MNILMLMMGGKGERFGAQIPKQYIMVENQPVFAYILQARDLVEDIDKIVIVSHQDWIGYVEDWINKLKIHTPCEVVAGGNTRSESVFNGLKSISDYAHSNDIVLIHDATHPYLDKLGVQEIIAAVKEFGGATLGAYQYDTVYQMDEKNIITHVLPRTQVVSGASPEAFYFEDIYGIYSKATQSELESMTSAGAIALAYGIQMKVVRANVLNLKITHQEDMQLFTDLASSYFFKKNK